MKVYKPVVPGWVAEILEKEKRQDVFAAHGHTKEWEEWKGKWSRKLKYARLNGWIAEENLEGGIKNVGISEE